MKVSLICLTRKKQANLNTQNKMTLEMRISPLTKMNLKVRKTNPLNLGENKNKKIIKRIRRNIVNQRPQK